jgi:hypothetical protein
MSDAAARPRTNPLKLASAVLFAAASVGLVIYSYLETNRAPDVLASGAARRQELRLPTRGRSPIVIKSEDGKRYLWAAGPQTLEDGEWFDITESPLDPEGYQFGIGKDRIQAIDEPRFVSINERAELAAERFNDRTIVIGYAAGGQAKAYPIEILEAHELVNDTVGGKPVTVGW